jgi:hypothetical protein
MPDAQTVDTSSYPKLPTSPPGVFDNIQKLQSVQQGQQAIQSNAIQIDKQQYDLVAQKWAGISKQMPGLIKDPNLTQDKIQQLYQDNVRQGLMTPDMAAQAISQIPPTAGMQPAQAAATLQQHLGQKLQQGQTIMEALEMHLPKPELPTINNQQVPSTVSRLPTSIGGGIRQTQDAIPVPLPVGQPTVSQGLPGQPPQGTPGVQGPVAPGTPSGLPTQPGGSILPFRPGNAPPQIQGTGGVPTAGGPKPVPTQSFTPTGNPPMFDEGKKQLAADQDMSTQKLTAIKPAMQALPLLDGIMAGPGTAAFTNALAGLKAFGIVGTSTNDPVAARQEVVKKLNQYVSSNPVGQRSDAAQTLAEASSPTPNVQILPALKKLTKDAIILDRVQSARAGAFDNQDLSKYPQFRSTFPAQIDERAFGLDLMDPKERQALLTQMQKKANTFEGKKFWKSLDIVDKQGLIDTGNSQ